MLENNIPTAEELLATKETFDSEYPTVSISDAIEAMIEFAKLHVEAALKEASENAEITWDGLPSIGEFQIIDKESILNSYPLTNIK